MKLAWDPSADPDVVTHAVYYGQLGGSDATRIEVGDSPNVVLNGLENGKTYFVYAVAIDVTGQESAPSNTLMFSPGPNSNADGAGDSAPDSRRNSPPGAPSDPVSAPVITELTQTFPTVAGQQYLLSFSLGAFSSAEETRQRDITLTISGKTTLLSQPLLLLVPGNGTSWADQTIMLTADADRLTVTIDDDAADSQEVSIYWDNVRLTQ